MSHEGMVDEANAAFGGPRGRPGLSAHVKGVRRNINDLRVAVERIAADDGSAMAWWSFSGLHSGPWLGRAPTNLPVRASVFSHFTLVENRVSHYRLWLRAELDAADGPSDILVFDTSRPELLGPVPEWFARNIAAPHTSHEIAVQGCQIVYLKWSAVRPSPAARQLVFVHGGSAHAHWWSHLIPSLLEDGAQAISVNLGGMGESQHRLSYSPATYADEIMSCATDAGFDRPLVIAHSFGGFVATACAALNPNRLTGVILVDSGVYPPGEEVDYSSGVGAGLSGKKTYPSLDVISTRFKLMPDNPTENPFIKAHFLKHAVVELETGEWTWRYDVNRRTLGKLYSWKDLQSATAAGVPFTVVYGARSSIWNRPPHVPQSQDERSGRTGLQESSSSMRFMRETLPEGTPFVEVADAGHHVMVDQPEALVAALREAARDERFGRVAGKL